MKLNNYSRSKITHILISLFATVLVGAFAYWWFQPSHIPNNFSGLLKVVDITLFLLVSYVIWHPIIMNMLTWAISLHIHDIRRQKPMAGMKVAFITTIVPSKEPIELLFKCLPAMVKAQYPHDTWLLDEGNSEVVKKICRLFGVHHFSRQGRGEYNTRTGKYTKTKGGNHNSWYDVHGDSYDYVAQIDTDFIPKSNFLVDTLGYFRDPTVAFVGTPQIYANTSDSLISLGASQQQFSFYGAVLRGLSGLGMNLLIGANHVVRVSAFKTAGHYTAHITEDLITGIKLHANGWKSVYVPYPLANGEGPTTWDAYFNQQLRWAFGCMDILFHHSPKLLKKLGFRQAFYYFFLQQHYFAGVIMALSVVLLSIYFAFGIRAADVDTIRFFTFYSVTIFICWIMSIRLQRFDINPKKEGELLLAGNIISIAAWPIWFIAFMNVMTGKKLRYKVTPKGQQSTGNRESHVVFLPHIFFAAVAIIGFISSLFTHRDSPVMLFWAISTAVLLLTIPFVSDIVDIYSLIDTRIRQYFKNEYKRTTIEEQNESYQFVAFDIPLLTEFKKRAKRNWATLFPKTILAEKITDSLFLVSIVLLSSSTYISKLGFYSDDWSFLGNFLLAHNHSLLGLYQSATTANTQMRPMQNLYDAVLYMLFGLQPIGYQLVNLFVFTLVILLFYLILRQVRIPRIFAVTVVTLFALLPNYATDRFWFAAFQVNLSMCFFLLSTYAGLRSLLSSSTKTFWWKCVSLVSIIISALSYEVALPLVLLNMVLFWNPVRLFNYPLRNGKEPVQNHSVFIAINFIILLYLVAFKAVTTTRLGTLNYPNNIGHLLTSIFQVNYGMLGLKLPLIWFTIMTKYLNPQAIIIALFIYCLIFLYTYLHFSIDAMKFPTKKWLGYFTLSGIIIFILGYTIFFTNNRVGFSPTGIDNRVAIAATIGIAISFVGLLGLISRLLFTEHLAKWLFSMLIAILGTLGFLITNTLALFWISAYQQSQIVVTNMQQHIPTVTPNSSYLLDGVCPYQGPGVVFESQWDLRGALQLHYKNESLRADIITPRMKVTKDGIVSKIYTFATVYPYANLYIYNYKLQHVFPIHSRNEATNYFQKYNPDLNNGCPAATAGSGVAIF